MPEITIVIHSCANCKHFFEWRGNDHYGDCTWQATVPLATSYCKRTAYYDWVNCQVWTPKEPERD